MAEVCSLKAGRRILMRPRPLACWESNHSTSHTRGQSGIPSVFCRTLERKDKLPSGHLGKYNPSTQQSSTSFINHSATLPSILLQVIGLSGVVHTRIPQQKYEVAKLGLYAFHLQFLLSCHLHPFPQVYRVSTPTLTGQGSPQTARFPPH